MMIKRRRGTKRRSTGKRPAPPPFPGRLVVIGGQCRKVGKTALVVDLIKAFPRFHWTAVKITPHAESGCPVNGAKCDCDPGKHMYAIRTEKTRKGTSDTSRYLAAGAKRAIWVQTKTGQLKEALAALTLTLRDAENVIIESNAVLQYWRADLLLLVLDPRTSEFKISALGALRCADAFVFRSPDMRGAFHKRVKIPNSGKPKFLQPLGHRLPTVVQRFVRQHFLRFSHHKGKQIRRIFS